MRAFFIRFSTMVRSILARAVLRALNSSVMFRESVGGHGKDGRKPKKSKEVRRPSSTIVSFKA